MQTAPHHNNRLAAPGGAEAHAFRPDSAALIHTVVLRHGGAPATLDPAARQREAAERAELSAALQALHGIAIAQAPAPFQRLVREAEVTRAAAVLRRLKLLRPGLNFAQIVDHCTRAGAASDSFGHLVDPFQLRHLLTFHDDIPHEELTAIDLYDLDRVLENGPDSGVAAWFARLETRLPALPASTPAFLRHVFARACAAGVPATRLSALSFELSVLTLRLQNLLGFEDTRLFFSLLKQIKGEAVPGLESYLEAADAAHAATQHSAAGHSRPAWYFRQLAAYFDDTALPALERRVAATVAERTRSVPVPLPLPVPAPAPVAPVEPRRGFLASVFELLGRRSHASTRG